MQGVFDLGNHFCHKGTLMSESQGRSRVKGRGANAGRCGLVAALSDAGYCVHPD